MAYNFDPSSFWNPPKINTQASTPQNVQGVVKKPTSNIFSGLGAKLWGGVQQIFSPVLSPDQVRKTQQPAQPYFNFNQPANLQSVGQNIKQGLSNPSTAFQPAAQNQTQTTNQAPGLTDSLSRWLYPDLYQPASIAQPKNIKTGTTGITGTSGTTGTTGITGMTGNTETILPQGANLQTWGAGTGLHVPNDPLAGGVDMTYSPGNIPEQYKNQYLQMLNAQQGQQNQQNQQQTIKTGDVNLGGADGSLNYNKTSDIPATQSDVEKALTTNQQLLQKYLETLTPSATETAAQQNILDLQKRAQDIKLSEAAGLQNIQDQPIPMEFITGQQRSVESRANLQLQTIAAQETAATAQAQLLSGNRQAQQDATAKLMELQKPINIGSTPFQFNMKTGSYEPIVSTEYGQVPSSQIIPSQGMGNYSISDVQPVTSVLGMSQGDAAIVSKLLNYQMAMPSGFVLRQPAWQKILQAVALIDPTWSQAEYPARAKQKQDFTSGKTATNIRSLNTAVAHLDTLKSAADKLNNSPIQLWNQIANYGLTAVGDPRVTNFLTAANAVESELASVFKGMGATDQEIKAWRTTLNEAMSPEQLHGAINTAIELMTGRIQAIGSQWDASMGRPRDFSIINDKSKSILQGMGYDVSNIDPVVNFNKEQAAAETGTVDNTTLNNWNW